MKKLKNKLSRWGIILYIISIAFVVQVIYQNRNLYSSRFDGQKFKRLYQESQWMVPNSTKPISDETLYSYAGYRYVLGENPILINPEAPPLGKYMIGLSILVFQNEKIINVIIACLSLILIGVLTHLISKSLFASGVAVLLTATNSLFIDQLIHNPQLEIYQAFFLLLALLFFILYEKYRATIYVICAGISIGYFFSVKTFTYYFALIISMFILYVLLKIKGRGPIILPIKAIRSLIIVLCISILVFCITYISFFCHGGTIRGFLGTQKWIFLFYRSSQIDMFKTIGSYVSLIFVNRWRFWSDGYPFIPYQGWDVSWMILFIASLFGLVRSIKNKQILILSSFFIVYNVFLMVTPIYPRYLLLLFISGNILIGITIPFIPKSYENKK